MGQKDIKRAVAIGISLGFLGAITGLSAITGTMFKENYEINKLRKSPEKRVNITEYHSTSNASYVCMFGKAFSERYNALYTDSLATCTALIIDSPLQNKHGIYHVTSEDESQEIENFINSNISSFKGVEVYIQEGDYSNFSTKNIYRAMKNLGLQNKVNFISQNNRSSSDKILIKDGKLYIPRK